MTLIFRYKLFKPTGGQERKRPLLPVTFTNGDQSFETVGLLDSGADFVTMSREMAEALGIDLDGKKGECSTPSGTAACVIKKVNMGVTDGHESYSLTVPVSVVLVKEFGSPPILGRIGFFDEFEVTINQRKEKIWLKKIGNSVDRGR